MATRKVLVRARNKTEAKNFAKFVKKLSTFNFSGERVTSVKLNKKVGLAGGIKGFTVSLTRKKVQRFKRGKKIGQLKPRFNK